MKKSTLKKVLIYLKKYRFLMILSLLFAIISVVSTLLIPIFIGKSIDNIVGKNDVDFTKLKNYSLLIIIMVVILAISQYIMNIINNKITFNVSYDLRKDCFNKIHKLPLSYIDSHPHGDIVSRNINDVDAFTDGLLMGFTQLFTGVLTIIITLVLMIILNPLIALLVFVLTPISLFVAKFIASRSFMYFKKQSECKGEQTSFVEENISNLKAVLALNHEKKNQENFEIINNDLQKSSLKAIFYSSIVNPTTRFINAIIYALVALLGAFVILKNPLGLTLTVGTLSTLLSYANQYSKPFNEISGVVTELSNSLVCVSRVFDFIEEKEMDTSKESKHLDNATGNIKLEHVYFSYTKNQKLIEDFNLNVLTGQKIAIVGPTGCGKTTLINLLMRFYDPTSGKILIDNLDNATIYKEDVRNNFGMVLQDTWLKNASVMDNVRMGKKDATEEQVVQACKEAHAHNFIMKLPQGYHTIISDDGNFSAGQKQLLCIARILLLMPPILILDEATSSIDTNTEMKIQNAFYKLSYGKTSFVVAHRLSTIKEADIILVMNNGNVIEQGNHEELLKKKGFYYQLYNSQFEN